MDLFTGIEIAIGLVSLLGAIVTVIRHISKLEAEIQRLHQHINWHCTYIERIERFLEEKLGYPPSTKTR